MNALMPVMRVTALSMTASYSILGFLGTDLYLMELHGWLGRIGYRPYFSGIGINADCPNLLIERHLNETIAQALAETGRKIHLIGHSLGGVIARSAAGCSPERRRFGDYPGVADSRHSDESHDSSCCGSCAPAIAGTRRQRAASLLYGEVHLQFH